MSSFPNKEKIISLYESLLKKYKKGPLALGWADGEEAQKLRFAALLFILKFLPYNCNFTLLDLGCGRGDLYAFLKEEKILSKYRIKYTGYDLATKMIEDCRRRFTKVGFQVKDIMDMEDRPKYDVVMASGIFNLKLADRRPEHMRWVFRILSKMYAISKLGMAVDFQSQQIYKYIKKKPGQKVVWCAYAIKEVIEMCEKITPKFILFQGYIPYNFSIYLLR
jgi:SAM-dependent methyltransferase